MPVHVSLDALPGLLFNEVHDSMEAAEEALRVTVHTEAPRIIQDEIAKAQPRQPVDRGGYKRDWHIDDVEAGVVIYNSSKHAGVLEDGRRSGTQPPIEALARWAIRKGIVGKAMILPREKGKHARAAAKLVARDVEETAARHIAFLIARKMKKQGWPFAPNQPMRILAKAGVRITAAVVAAVGRAIAQRGQ